MTDSEALLRNVSSPLCLRISESEINVMFLWETYYFLLSLASSKWGLLVLMIHPVGFKDFSVGHILIPHKGKARIQVHAHMKNSEISTRLDFIQID